jgi:hypothetical protein
MQVLELAFEYPPPDHLVDWGGYPPHNLIAVKKGEVIER